MKSCFINKDGIPRAWLRLLLFYVAGLGVPLLLMVATAALFRVLGVEVVHPGPVTLVLNPWLLAVLGLVVLVPVVGVALAARRWLDRRRPLSSLGLRGRDAPRNLAVGFAGGVAFIGVTCAAIFLAGGAEFHYAPPAAGDALRLLGPLALFALFAAAEEFYLRGYPVMVLDESWGRVAAVLLTSVVFSVLHLMNPGAGVLPFVNVALAGVILALIYLRSGSLWLAIGFHWGWNFGEGPLLGFSVSGMATDATLFEAAPKGAAWLSGGAFGPEGSVALTVTGTILILLLVAGKIPRPGAPEAVPAEGSQA
ncbi:MAG: CPBP family intramembrane metalloprotease [Candidatus Zixiibacteriota bacterium]